MRGADQRTTGLTFQPMDVKMTEQIDMSAWQGRVDTGEGERARRWHQWVRPLAPDAPAGVALVGFACDEGVRRNQGRTGAALGPGALRRALANLAWHGDRYLHDAGDVVCADEQLETAQETFAARLARLLDEGHLPIGLGGGHEIAFASFSGLSQHLRRHCETPRIGILNLDAHLDLRHAERPSSGTPFRQIAELCERQGMPFHYCCLGVSRPNNTAALFAAADRLQVRYRLDHQVSEDPAEAEALLDRMLAEVDHLYLTLCLDVLPAGQAPGVSAPATHGVALPLVERLVRRAAASGKLRLADVAELNPRLDCDGLTARSGARLIHALLA